MKFYIPSEGKFTKDVPDDKIVGFVTKYPDAIPVAEEGAPPMQQPAPAAPTTPQPETTLGGMMGGAVRAAALPATAAAVGAAMGAPAGGIGAVPGAFAGAGTALLSQMVLDPAFGFINRQAGTNLPIPSQALQDFLTELGVPEPDTAAERIVQQATAGAASALGGVGVGQQLLRGATPLAPATRAQIVGRALSDQPARQAVAGFAGGGAGQIATEQGAGPLGQFAASTLAGGTVAAAPTSVRKGVSTALANIGKEADAARVATAGPDAVKAARKALGGVDEVEMARVMRAGGMGGVVSPQKLAERAASTQKEAGGLIGSIIGAVDEQTAALMKQIDDARSALAQEQADLDASLSSKVKAAEEAAARAAEIEKAAAAANARLAAEQQEFFRAATTSGKAIAEKPIKEPGVVRLDKMDLQKAAKDAADEAAAKTAAAKEAMKAAQKQEKLTTKGSFAPDPLTGEAVLAPSGRDPLMFKAMILQNEADAATARAAQLAQEARAGAASFEQPMPIRAVVGASSAMKGRQREVDMVNAAAKKAREEADRFAKEAQPTAEQQAFLDQMKANVDKLSKEADKRMVDGSKIASKLDADAQSVLSMQNATTADQLDESNRATYNALTRSANELRGRKLTLAQVQARISNPAGGLARTAKFEKKGDIPEQGKALGAQAEISELRGGMDVAVEEALSAPGAQPASMASPLAAVGRDAPITGVPTGKQAYQSGRRVYDVAKEVSESAAVEAERLAKKPLVSPFVMPAVAGAVMGSAAGGGLGAVPGALAGGMGAKYLAEYGPSLIATGREAARSYAPRVAPAGPLPTASEQFLATLPYGAASIEDMLRQIDEESAP